MQGLDVAVGLGTTGTGPRVAQPELLERPGEGAAAKLAAVVSGMKIGPRPPGASDSRDKGPLLGDAVGQAA